jgi:hypothetical protein
MNTKSLVSAGVGVAAALLLSASPSEAQLVGTISADPVTFANNIARAVMLAAGAVMVVAGGYKALQVWSGQRQLFDASTALFGGATLVFGTAAMLGFG